MILQRSGRPHALALAAALACAGAAHAQSADAYNPSDYVLLNGSAVKPDSKYPTDRWGPGGGIKLGIPVTPNIDLQIGGNYGRSRSHGDTYHQWTGGIDALYLFTPGGFRPFVMAGVGAVRDSVKDPLNGNFHRTAPYLDAGLGFQWKITPQLGIQADAREVGSFYRHRETTIDARHTANTYLDVGLTWAFGTAPAPAPRPVAAVEPPPPPPAAIVVPPPPPPPAPPPPPPQMRKYTLSASELFGFNSAKLGSNQPKLDEVAQVLNNQPDIAGVTIIGYTDRIGSKPYNQKLSVERAEAVKAYLVGKGVQSSRLEAVGKGEADPVVECKGITKRAPLIKCLEPNRRVEIQPVTYTKPAKQ
jgi:OOP family OmpA-OmpF porin